ncbi:hypothetical protein BB560_000129 [Smittium megazygosporum]|uniref:J domain-containing protein n=1 Tax=Smittium megazygosporum TaxID=133381 RepID=A0A2T9ZL80_9FUNG|nr:hypothetical protein BB560_000129 [Smittium megazygosporum]
MAQYTYDESGVTFYFYALTVLVLILIPSSFYVLRADLFSDSKADTKAKTLKIRKKPAEKKSKWRSIKYFILSGGWLVFLLIGYNVKTAEYTLPDQWDPYAVLGLDSGATPAQIKKAFRKLSLKFHPDKVRDMVKEEAEARYIDINRANKALTDDEARENFEKYGNPDGLLTRTMGIALPRILIEAKTSPILMALYGLVVGFLLPYYVGRWWYGSSRYTKDKILNPTMITFFKNIREPISLKNLIDLLTAAEEFNTDGLEYKPSEEEAIKKLEVEVSERCKFYGFEYFYPSEEFTSKSAFKAKVLLYCHFYRVPIEDQELATQQQVMIEKSIHLVHKGLVQISTVHGWTACTVNLLRIIQMLVQGVHEGCSPLLQLPYMDCITYKSIAQNHALYGLSQAKNFPEADRRAAFSYLGDKADIAIKSIDAIPEVEIARTILSVIGDRVITPLSIVTLILKVKLVGSENVHIKDSFIKDVYKRAESTGDDDIEGIEKLFNDISKMKPLRTKSPEALAPYLAAKKQSNWWLILSNMSNSRNVVSPILITDLISEKVISVQFQAPNVAGSYDFQVNIVSDSFVGCDISKHIKMVVSDPTLLPPEPEVDDDISEPEANSFAAELSQARNQSGRNNRNNFDDSSDED